MRKIKGVTLEPPLNHNTTTEPRLDETRNSKKIIDLNPQGPTQTKK